MTYSRFFFFFFFWQGRSELAVPRSSVICLFTLAKHSVSAFHHTGSFKELPRLLQGRRLKLFISDISHYQQGRLSLPRNMLAQLKTLISRLICLGCRGASAHFQAKWRFIKCEWKKLKYSPERRWYSTSKHTLRFMASCARPTLKRLPAKCWVWQEKRHFSFFSFFSIDSLRLCGSFR